VVERQLLNIIERQSSLFHVTDLIAQSQQLLRIDTHRDAVMDGILTDCMVLGRTTGPHKFSANVMSSNISGSSGHFLHFRPAGTRQYVTIKAKFGKGRR